MKDRTSEFFSAVSTCLSHNYNAANGYNDTASLLPKNSSASSGFPSASDSPQSLSTPKARASEFTLRASAIARDINNTHQKLLKLTKLAKRKTLFDDRPVEITELTSIIKQDIAKLNVQIGALQQFQRDAKQLSSSQQTQQHTSNVVVSLQTKLANTSISFKEILEVRTQNIKAQKGRRDQYSFTPQNQVSAIQSSDSPLYNPQRQTSSSSTLQMDQMQLQLATQEDAYITQRSQAIESIDSTIAELGGIFQQLAQMVSEQRESVQRIDANVEDIEMNIGGAQRELLKYYSSITSNRALMLKVFAVLIFFALVFVIVL